MKKNSFLILLLLLAFACNNNCKEQINANKVDTLSYTAPKVLTLGKDTIKLPTIIYLNTKPQPNVIVVPNKETSIYIDSKKNGEKIKLNLIPPTVIQMPVVSKKTNGETLLDQSIAAKGMFTNYTTDDGLAMDAVSVAHTDKNGNIWLATYGGGVSKYDGKTFVNYTSANGLADNMLLSIAEDKNGNLWFGTQGGGVSKYDGKFFTNYTTANGLAENIVLSIKEDKNGNIWFGTNGGGISKFDGKSFVNYNEASNVIYNILEDKIGNIWFATNSGVTKYDGNRVEAIEKGDKIAQQFQHDLKKINGKLVKSFVNYTTAQGLAHNLVYFIAEDNSGNLWFGTNGGGVSKYNNNSTNQHLKNCKHNLQIQQDLVEHNKEISKPFTNYTTNNGLVNNVVYSIVQDTNNNLWFGTDDGVSKFDGNTFNNFNTTQGLANNVVLSITKDINKNIWFGTQGGGLSKYNGAAFINYTSNNGLANNIVVSIGQDKNSNLWFGTYGGGVSQYNGKSFTNYTSYQGLVNDKVYTIATDKIGNLWLGTNGGISKFDGKTFVNYSTKQGLANNVIQCITEDKNGNLWIGTNGGVSKFDGKSFTNYTTAQGLIDNVILCITEDKNGNIWFGTYGSGISKFNGNSFVNYTTAQGLASDMVGNITEDKTGNLWFGTDKGISLILNKSNTNSQNSSFINYSTKDGLPDQEVCDVVEASNGKMLIGTNFGFCEMIPSVSNKQVNGYKVGRVFNSSTNYPVKDVNIGHHTMFKDNKGIIWIGTGADKTALVRYDEGAVFQNSNPPKIIFKKIKINGEDICWSDLEYYSSVSKNKNNKSKTDSLTRLNEEVTTFAKELSIELRNSLRYKFKDIQFDEVSNWYPIPSNMVLPYNHNNISIEFNAIETNKNSLVRYQYMLTGYDKEWNPITEKNNATFGNMYEGSYTFMLKAMSPEGVWSEPITYSFKVLPPWYRTWWLYTVYVLTLISFVWLMIWYNGRKLKAKAIELKQKVDEATYEIKEQKYVIEQKHKEITDSINYAERIQRSFLATEEILNNNLKDYFVFFQPKDIVSGDFYWATKLQNNKFVLVTADSTGHGVPGAIMSLLNITSLEKAIENNSEPAAILNATRKAIIERLKKDGSAEGGKDGMDASLIAFDFENYKMTYAAANNPIWIVRNSELLEFTSDKMPIGKHDKDYIEFTQHTIDLQKGDVVYAITDGMPDQFGGIKGKKFMYKQLKEFFIAIASLPMHEQKQKINNTLITWKGDLEQVDDICIVGVRIS